MKLDGIAISGYRSFGDELVKVSDLEKINIFIGKNNSGKSNILKFFKCLSEIKIQDQYKGFNQQLDYCVDPQTKGIHFGYQIKKILLQLVEYTVKYKASFQGGKNIFLSGLIVFGLPIQ